jgi:hypothetical protein
MSGEGESMKKWGVIVRDSAVQARLLEQGLIGLTGEALLQAQAQARLEIAYNQSKNALTNVTSETVLALDVARRYDEAWKERKEIVGEATTNFFTPIKLKIAEQIEAWNDATLAKKNYDAALSGDPTADLSAAIAKQQQEVDDLYKQLEKFANPDTLAKKWFYEGADWLRTAVGGNTVVDEILAEIREEELKLQQLSRDEFIPPLQTTSEPVPIFREYYSIYMKDAEGNVKDVCVGIDIVDMEAVFQAVYAVLKAEEPRFVNSRDVLER